MKYRKLTAEGDYTLGLGKQNFISDAQAVAQAVKTRLLLLYGEWWENIEDGLPLFEQILGKFGIQGKDTADLLIRQSILSTQGVSSISNFSSSLNKQRQYTFSCTLNTIYGLVTLTEVNI